MKPKQMKELADEIAFCKASTWTEELLEALDQDSAGFYNLLADAYERAYPDRAAKFFTQPEPETKKVVIKNGKPITVTKKAKGAK
jgi:hypothetical protein